MHAGVIRDEERLASNEERKRANQQELIAQQNLEAALRNTVDVRETDG
jgi:hypothetical protein